MPCEELALERGEEALAHGIVVRIAHRPHRRAHASVAAALAEPDRGVLRTLVRVVDHSLRPPPQKRHVQSAEHQLGGKCRRHRPADDAAAIRIEHDGEIEKAGPRRYISNIRHPQPIRRFCRELALDQVRCLTATILDRGGDEPASAHTGETGLRHQSRHPLASNMTTLGRKLGVNARRTIGATRSRVRGTDRRDQRGVGLRPLRWLTLCPRVVAAGGDTQQTTHRGDRI